MKQWGNFPFDLLRECEEESEIVSGIKARAVELGFDYWAYGLRVPIAFEKYKVIQRNNYSDEWNRHYKDSGYIAIDPTVKHGMKSNLPIIWSDHTFKDASALWDDARDCGLNSGWAQAFRSPNGHIGLVTFARSTADLSTQELEVKQPHLTWLAQTMHELFYRQLRKDNVLETEQQLTHRELEVLRWTAAGKTSAEVAIILNISERTIEFHVRNILLKLGCTNKLAAAVKAVLSGILV